MIEIDRVRNNIRGEVPPPPMLIIETFYLDNPDYFLNKVKEVVISLSSIPQEIYNSNNYKDWIPYLPNWLTEPMMGNSLDDLLDNVDLWDIELWIDSISHREWSWWSSSISENGFIIYLETFAFPYQIDPLVYAIQSTGILSYKIKVSEILN